ncbi:hypothetical protein EVAR_74353_1 [Eumeta japonica]|uniref:Nucleic-acid-binding protein from transposon X-element n=1 Tax=Eumeta variegata TaxID=151549 RepID=A0A4C1SFZ3_EUMVA|nr:hypothetical protein EVAR_74353_1 [Eumeta japonica]
MLLRKRSPLYTSNVGVLPSFRMCSPSESRKSQRSTPRASLRSLPHHTLQALTSPPRIILSVPSFEQTYRTRSSSCDVFAVEGLTLFDVHIAVQDYDGCFDGSPSRSRLLNDSVPRVPSQLVDIPNLGFLNNGYRNFFPFSLNEQPSRSKLTSLQVGLYEPQRYALRSLQSPALSGKRTASSVLSSEELEVFGATIRGSDDDVSDFQIVKPRKTHQRSVHRLHRRKGTSIGLVLAALNQTNNTKDIFKKFLKVCSLFGITLKASYKRGGPGQCQRCQQYGHTSAHCHAQLKCLKCAVPHLTLDCTGTKNNPRNKSRPTNRALLLVDNNNFLALDKNATKMLPETWRRKQPSGTTPELTNRQMELPVCITTNKNRRKLSSLADKLELNVLSRLTLTGFPNNNQHKPDILDIVLFKGVAPKLGAIEILQRLNSDHRPVLYRASSFIIVYDDESNPVRIITNWKRVLVAFEKIDISASNDVPKGIVSTDEIDHAIRVLTTLVRTVVNNKSRKVSTNTDHQKLPRDILCCPEPKTQSCAA